MGMEGRGKSEIDQGEKNAVRDGERAPDRGATGGGERSLSEQMAINQKVQELTRPQSHEATVQTAAREESEINDIRASIQKTFESPPDTYGLKGSEIIQ